MRKFGRSAPLRREKAAELDALCPQRVDVRADDLWVFVPEIVKPQIIDHNVYELGLLLAVSDSGASSRAAASMRTAAVRNLVHFNGGQLASAAAGYSYS